jgi:hypothetical protein
MTVIDGVPGAAVGALLLGGVALSAGGLLGGVALSAGGLLGG